MAKIYSILRVIITYCLIFVGLSGCFTVHTHQTAKTLGKGEFKKTIVSGLSGIPNFSGEEVTYQTGGIMFPNYTYQYGLGEYSDIGAYLGITKMGAFYKHQLLGDKTQKGRSQWALMLLWAWINFYSSMPWDILGQKSPFI